MQTSTVAPGGTWSPKLRTWAASTVSGASPVKAVPASRPIIIPRDASGEFMFIGGAFETEHRGGDGCRAALAGFAAIAGRFGLEGAVARPTATPPADTIAAITARTAMVRPGGRRPAGGVGGEGSAVWVVGNGSVIYLTMTEDA